MDLDALAAPTPDPAAGAALAEALAIAAALVELAAGVSGLDEPVRRANELRTAASALGERDAQAYRVVLDAPDAGARAAALRAAAEPPLELARHADEAAELAGEVARRCKEVVRGDALAAQTLAEAVAVAARRLAQLNLRATES